MLLPALQDSPPLSGGIMLRFIRDLVFPRPTEFGSRARTARAATAEARHDRPEAPAGARPEAENGEG
jgi:hypothetical protein